MVQVIDVSSAAVSMYRVLGRGVACRSRGGCNRRGKRAAKKKPRETIELVEAVNKPMIFVVNNASTNGRLTLDAVTALSQYGTVAPTIIHTRQDYRSSMSKGRVAGEVSPKGKSAAEIGELWAYIQTRLNKEAQYGAAA
jgi:hypothetical protein